MMKQEKKHRIFLVEDDESFGSVLKSYLEMNDYEVYLVRDGRQAMKEFAAGEYDMCILDIMLPHVDGFALAREVKAIQPSLPMIFLTAKTLKKDILQGYELGADDYVTKPFDSDVLLCKMRAILSRRGGNAAAGEQLKIGRYRYDPDQRILSDGDATDGEVSDGGTNRKLSPKEGHLLQMLAGHKNTVLSREHALKQIWGQDDYFAGRSMDVYITRLRKYLKDDPALSIENIHGSGYILKEEGQR